MKTAKKASSPALALRRPDAVLLEQLAPEQRLAVEKLASRMDVDQTEVLVRLIGAALFVAGHDRVGQEDLDLIIGASVPADRFDAACDYLTNSTLELHDWTVARNAEERRATKGTAA